MLSRGLFGALGAQRQPCHTLACSIDLGRTQRLARCGQCNGHGDVDRVGMPGHRSDSAAPAGHRPASWSTTQPVPLSRVLAPRAGHIYPHAAQWGSFLHHLVQPPGLVSDFARGARSSRGIGGRQQLHLSSGAPTMASSLASGHTCGSLPHHVYHVLRRLRLAVQRPNPGGVFADLLRSFSAGARSREPCQPDPETTSPRGASSGDASS